MTIVLRGMTRQAAEAIDAGERPGDVRVADHYLTEFSAGLGACDARPPRRDSASGRDETSPSRGTSPERRL